jgi:hypothetical protein
VAGARQALPEGLREGIPGEDSLRRSDEDQPVGDAQLELTTSLRAGLEGDRLSVGSSGLSLGLPPGTNPFDHFAGLQPEAAGQVAPDLQEEQPAAARQEAPAAPPADGGASLDLKVALMIQTMAAFGGPRGEGEWHNRDRAAPRYEYFA